MLNRGCMQEAYRALADPHRRTILRVLRRGEETAGELANATGLRPAALTHHLTVLKLANLVRVERRGQYQVYSLNTTVFQDLVSEVLSLLSEPTSGEGSTTPTRGDST
jgi:ArsR family transcriptional regulator, arsenate/arsenite/antimonite-responsive transcriptional repressor